MLQIPFWRKLIGRLLVKNIALMRENFSMLEKITCRDQKAVYLGTIINMYMYTVYTCTTELVIFWWIFKWYTQHGPNNLTDKRYMCHVHWKLKCLDQIGRDGGLYHSLREQNMYDRYIVLSAERLYAIDISDFLLERNYRRYHEREKQILDDWLPDLNILEKRGNLNVQKVNLQRKFV